ncbi:MAG: hypothetical protein LBR69_03030 [Endomicrobium sp.]|jgi:hypothetical protein|nr:hypothetical protein [Endomicrobium sp.]
MSGIKDTKRTIVEIIVAIIVIAIFFVVSVFKMETGQKYLDKYTPVIVTVTGVIDKLIADDTSNDTLSVIDAAMRAAKNQFEIEYSRPPDNKEINRLQEIIKNALEIKGLPGEYDSGLKPEEPD